MGDMSWSSMAASVAPCVLVISQTISAMVSSRFCVNPAESVVTKQATCKSEVTDHGIWSVNEAMSPGQWERKAALGLG